MAPSKRLGLFVFIDAFGWQLAQRHAFLDGILTIKKPLDTIFGYSSTCDPTILTGELPRVHGHFSFFVYSPAQSPFRHTRWLDVVPKALTSRGRFRNKFSNAVRWWLGYTGYFQLYNMPFRYLSLFDYTEKRDLYQPGGIINGTPTIFDYLRERRISFHLSDWRNDEPTNFRALEAALETQQPGFAYLYLAGMDAVLHTQGTRSPRVADHLAHYERELTRILECAARRYESVRLYVFSDHGMTDIRATCDLMRRIDALDIRFGVDYAAVYDSTMARFWFLNDRARDAVVRALESEPQGCILADDRLAAWGCDFSGRRYGELFFLMDPGVLICPSFMGERPMAGMHGYAPDHADSTAAFMTNAPLDRYPQRLDDLYPVMKANIDSWAAA